MRSIYYIIIFFALLISPKSAVAENLILPIPDLNQKISFSLGEDKPITGINKLKPEKLSFPDIESNKYSLKSNYWSDYANQSHTLEFTKYSGFQEVAYNQIKRLAMRFYYQKSDNFFNEMRSNYSFLENQKKLEDLNLGMSDFKYRWWERSFSESLTVEKGGIVNITNLIGKESEFVDFGIFNVTNIGRVSLDDYWFDVSTATETIKKPEGSPDDLDLYKKRLLLGIITPTHNFLRTDTYAFTGNIKFNIRADQFNKDNSSGITALIKFSALHKDSSWMEIQVKGIGKPLIKEYGAEISIQLFIF